MRRGALQARTTEGALPEAAQDLCIPFAMGDNLTCTLATCFPLSFASQLSMGSLGPAAGQLRAVPSRGASNSLLQFGSFFCWREAHQRIRRLSKMDGLCIAQVVVSGWPSRLPSELPGKALEEVLKCLAQAAQHGELREDGAVPGSQCPVLSRF